MTSTTFIFTRSQPRSLLSMTRLKRVRSRWFSASSSRTLIAQTCLGLSGRFWPTMRPLFQAGRSTRIAGKYGVSMMDTPIHHALPHRKPDVDKKSYYMMLLCIRGLLRVLSTKCCMMHGCLLSCASQKPSTTDQVLQWVYGSGN